MMGGIRLIGLTVNVMLASLPTPQVPSVEGKKTLHWARSLLVPSTMHADPKSLVPPETRPDLLGERRPKDTTRTSNTRAD